MMKQGQLGRKRDYNTVKIKSFASQNNQTNTKQSNKTNNKQTPITINHHQSPSIMSGEDHKNPSLSLPRAPPDRVKTAIEQIFQEWQAVQAERAAWQLERTQLRNRILQLESEARSHEKIRLDLIRRVKILEYGLLSERAHRLNVPLAQLAAPHQFPNGSHLNNHNSSNNIHPKITSDKDDHAYFPGKSSAQASSQSSALHTRVNGKRHFKTLPRNFLGTEPGSNISLPNRQFLVCMSK